MRSLLRGCVSWVTSLSGRSPLLQFTIKFSSISLSYGTVKSHIKALGFYNIRGLGRLVNGGLTSVGGRGIQMAFKNVSERREKNLSET